MIIRYRSNIGQGRLELNPDDTVRNLFEKLKSIHNVTKVDDINAAYGDLSLSSINWSSKLSDVEIRHGSIVNITVNKSEFKDNEIRGNNIEKIEQDPLDDEMSSLPCIIERELDPLLCTHNNQGKCYNCLPLPSYDPKYLKSRNIKHLSFYSYYNKCKNEAPLPPNGISIPYLLELPEVSVKNPCPTKTHKPWPEGVCTSCTPPSVTLQRQTFRMVDHVEFESAHIIERFVEYWRITGEQRFGYLYGRYAPYLEVPLGVKVIVCSIYEPPQDSSNDSIQLTLPNPQLELVDKMASKLGLRRVGIIYTDLLDDCTGTGKVVCKRHYGSYYLSSAECLMSAEMQLANPTRLKCAKNGVFSSRMVTCVTSGNLEGHIDVSCYQTSVLCEALCKEKLILPCINPNLMKLRQNEPNKLAPTVSYTKTDSFGLKRIETANPIFPTEYLIVTCSHGFPKDRSPTFSSDLDFTIENREKLKKQSLSDIAQIIESPSLAKLLSEFHLLLFLNQAGILDQNDLQHIYNLVLDPEEDITTLLCRDNWRTLEMIATNFTEVSKNPIDNNDEDLLWDCSACTYRNTGNRIHCEMCNTPKPS